MFLLGACTTYSVQTASNTDVEMAVAIVTAESNEQPELNDDDIACKPTIVAGSRFKKRTCMTRRDRREMAKRSKDDLDAVQRRNRRN